MIAKGLDFPNVTLVGVLNADTSLNLPDYRSSERTFQLLDSGGRKGPDEQRKKERLSFKATNPNHYAIRFAKDQDYEGFLPMKCRFAGSWAIHLITSQLG